MTDVSLEHARRRLRTRLVALPVYYGWLVVATCFLASLVTFGTIYTFGVYFEAILGEFGRTYAGTSTIFSFQSIVTFGAAAFLGVGVDRYGVQRLVLLGCGLVVGGLLLVSIAPTFLGVVVAYGTITALGFGTLFVIAYATPARWFTDRRGVATAVATAGTGVGVVVVPPLMSALLPTIGWRGGYVLLAGAFVGLSAVAWVVIEDRPTDVPGAVTHRFHGSDRTESGSYAGDVRGVLDTGWSPRFLLLFAGTIFAFAPAYILLVQGVEHATTAGFTRGVGVVAISLLGGMNIVGKFIVGPISDRFGTLTAMALCAVATGAGGLVLPDAGTPQTFLVVTGVVGLGYGGMGALISPAIAELFGTLNINALFGLAASAFAITGSVVPLLAGVGFDHFGSFSLAFRIAGGAAFLAVGLFVLADGW